MRKRLNDYITIAYRAITNQPAFCEDCGGLVEILRTPSPQHFKRDYLVVTQYTVRCPNMLCISYNIEKVKEKFESIL